MTHARQGWTCCAVWSGWPEYNAGRPKLIELHVIVSGEGTSAEHPLHDYFVRRYEVVFEMIRDAFDEAGERGELRPAVDSAVAARAVIALMDGLQLQWLLHRDQVDMSAELRRYLQLPGDRRHLGRSAQQA